MKIQYRVLLSFATIILIMIIGTFLSIQMSKESLRESIGRNHVIQAQRIMENIDREIYYRIEEITGYGTDILLRDTLRRSNQAMAEMADRDGWIKQQELAWLAAPQGTTTPFMEALMNTPLAEELREKKEFFTQEWLKHPVYPEMYVTNKYGVIIATTSRTSDYLLAEKDWYRKAAAQRKFWLGNLRYDERPRTHLCDIVVPIYDEDQQFSGLFKAVLNIETIQSFLKNAVEQNRTQSKSEYSTQVELLTRDNRLIFTSGSGDDLNKDMSGPEFMGHIARGSEQGFFTASGDLRGKGQNIFAYARSSGYRDYKGLGWIVILEQDLDEVFAPVESFSRNMWAIAFVMVCVALLFTHYFSHSFAMLVTKLRETTEQLQQKITEQTQTENTLQSRSEELDERLKELHCLYGILQLVEEKNYRTEEILQGTVDLLFSSFRYPGITCARITLGDQTYKTDNFAKTQWLLSQEITVSGRKAGAVEVFSLKERSDRDGGPFLKDEKALIDALAEQLGNVLERIQATQERQQMQSFVFQQEKLASVGQLAAGVAHEINNPIGFISSNLGTLKKYIAKFMEYIAASMAGQEPEELQQLRKSLKIDFISNDINELISESVEGTERVREIVQNLKSFSRLDEVKCKEADINECLENTLKVIWNELKYKATVSKEYGKLPPIKCYPQQLNQVFMNFLVNAAQAIENRGEIRIKTWQDGKNIFVSISDTGQGIPAENISKLFEPFFTTKETGKGTGLGLSITHEIIQKHKGRIDVASKVGRGTTFTVTLPVDGIT